MLQWTLVHRAPAHMQTKHKVVLLAAASVVVGVVAAGGFSTTLEATNTTEFCTSCHSMQWVKAEWEESAHFSNVGGIRAQCQDCHVPNPLVPKLHAKMMAAKDVWHEILGTIDSREKFEAHRWEMANRVWRKMEASGSRECKSCHQFEAMDLGEQDKTARKKHKRAHAEGENCIACHKGVAHKRPKKPRRVAAE